MHLIKRLLCFLMLCILLPVSALSAVPDALLQAEYSRQVYLPNGAGPFQYYAQNDPVWNDAKYEAFRASYVRRFGEGGCNPTALAMVVATLLPESRLPEIRNYTNPTRDFLLCEHSVNEYHCQVMRNTPGHEFCLLETPQDYLVALPLVFGNYATGNNPTRHRYRILAENGGGTSAHLLAAIADVYGLNLVKTRDVEDVFKGLDNGAIAVALCSGVSQPFSNGNGHYVVVVSYDQEYIYILDPFIRDTYKQDRRKVIEHIEPGVKKVKIENIPRLAIGIYNLFSVE